MNRSRNERRHLPVEVYVFRFSRRFWYTAWIPNSGPRIDPKSNPNRITITIHHSSSWTSSVPLVVDHILAGMRKDRRHCYSHPSLSRCWGWGGTLKSSHKLRQVNTTSWRSEMKSMHYRWYSPLIVVSPGCEFHDVCDVDRSTVNSVDRRSIKN